MQVFKIACCVVVALSAAPRPAVSAEIVVPHCLVSLIDEAQVPAEESGVLLELAVREGAQVKAGDILARIDDLRAKMQLNVAKFRLEVAKEEAGNDVNIRYAVAAARVAESEYQEGLEANRKVKGAVPNAEIRRLYLTYSRSALEIEQAQMTQRIAELEAKVSQAEVDAADENLDRRLIKSPIDAVVVELYRHTGEWVQPGDPVMHVVRVNQLRVEGFLNAREVIPSEAADQPVRVVVELTRGRRETFQGKVTFVSPLVEAGGEFQVWADVENRTDPNSGQWVLRPGMEAEMTINLGK